MNIDSTVLSTPAGPLSILVGPDGDVRAAGSTRTRRRCWPWSTRPCGHRCGSGPISARSRAAVHSYLDGDLAAIDTVPVRQHTGGEFMAHAWQVLREVPPGTPVTYTGYAALAGRPPAVRAAAAACARNAAALFVPCHRVSSHRRHTRRLPLGAGREEVASRS